MASPFFISLLSAFSAYFIFVGFWRRRQSTSKALAMQQRLREFQAQSELGSNVMDDSGTATERRSDFLTRFGEQMAAAAFAGRGGQSLMASIDEKLVLAGRPHGWYAADYIAFCTLTIGASILGGGLLVQTGVPPFIYLALVGLTTAYCHYELVSRIKRRQQQAFFELPYVLDEIIMALSSGATSLDLALREVVDPQNSSGMQEKEKVLVREFRQAYQESASQARPFAEAFRAAANRIQVQEVGNLVEVLIEAKQGGDTVLHILRDMSVHVYAIFEQEMESLIKKKDTTFTVATVIMMFGSALVIGTPIVLTVLKALGGG